LIIFSGRCKFLSEFRTKLTPINEIKGEQELMYRIVCLVVIGLIAAAVPGLTAEPLKEKAAVAAAEKWLSLVDREQYGESWKETSAYFRNAVKQEQWEQSMQAIRKPLGKIVSRRVKSKSYSTSLPGAPDGKYVVIEFETSFEKKKSAVETVTPMIDKDGQWRVSGYFIK
jgi:hypothetical protein